MDEINKLNRQMLMIILGSILIGVLIGYSISTHNSEGEVEDACGLCREQGFQAAVEAHYRNQESIHKWHSGRILDTAWSSFLDRYVKLIRRDSLAARREFDSLKALGEVHPSVVYVPSHLPTPDLVGDTIILPCTLIYRDSIITEIGIPGRNQTQDSLAAIVDDLVLATTQAELDWAEDDSIFVNTHDGKSWKCVVCSKIDTTLAPAPPDGE